MGLFELHDFNDIPSDKVSRDGLEIFYYHEQIKGKCTNSLLSIHASMYKHKLKVVLSDVLAILKAVDAHMDKSTGDEGGTNKHSPKITIIPLNIHSLSCTYIRLMV